MIGLESIGFGAPWVLAALAILPAIWWLLKVTPPAPKQVLFPAIRLLLGLNPTDQTPAKTPLWLLILRLAAAAAIIIALSDPFVAPDDLGAGKGPVVIAVDNGWAAANRWDERIDTMRQVAQRAERTNRPLIIIPTAESDVVPELRATTGADAQGAIKAVSPQPFDVNRAKALEALRRFKLAPGADLIWLSDGLDDGNALAFAKGLSALGQLTVYRQQPGAGSLALTVPEAQAGALKFGVVRAAKSDDLKGQLRAFSSEGRMLGEVPFAIPSGQTRAAVTLDLPADLRNAMARAEIADHVSAGTVVLLDERWRRRPVGLISGQSVDTAQPLLSDLYYIDRALGPYADLRRGKIQELIADGLSVLILTDVGQIVGEDMKAVAAWVTQGGILVRFSGPKMAAQADDQIPGRLRTGGRLMGGAMSWDKPQSLAPFPENSPFSGLPVPSDITIRRQVLTDSVDGAIIDNWAQLTDGTPLVSAQRRGKGRIVLFHVTANTDWSNLPLAGLFVDMLRQTVALSAGVAERQDRGQSGAAALLSPIQSLDGFGRLVPPPGSALPVQAAQFADVKPGPKNPPGIYGEGGVRRALNLHKPETVLRELPALPINVTQINFGSRSAWELKFVLLAVAMVLVMIDGVASLILRGLIALPRAQAAQAAGLVFAALLAVGSDQAQAQNSQSPDAFAMKAALETRLAYVITGDPEVDAMSKAGLQGLSRILRNRTAVEPAEPIGLNVETDEMAFFPLIYWPISNAQGQLTPTALSRVDAYMKNGGTIFFDTRDQNQAAGAQGAGPGTAILRRLLAGLDVPPLEKLGGEHVLTKTFYLLQEFPGRWTGGHVWVEAQASDTGGRQLTQSDGVSPIVIGSNDWAAAWARDEFDRPLAAVTPGGDLQREIAMRFGVNLVMYALTGNYKADQVHVPAILERLGQ